VSERAIQIYKLIDLSASRLFTLTKMNFVLRKLDGLDLMIAQNLSCLEARYHCKRGEMSYKEGDFGSALAFFTKILEIGSVKYSKRMWPMFISCQEELGHSQEEIIAFLEKLL
jgi:hypothetical protein